ncbi:MAG: transketolase [Deltaproteobacteria bacterium]|nr:transketolase [Deltaproteobacteria bacterium]
MQISKARIDELKEIARHLRIDCLKMLHKAKSGHTGGPLGIMDMMTALYFEVMRQDPKNPTWPDRDRFILSNGHTCPALYVILAKLGYFPADELSHLRQLGSALQGHPKLKVEWGIEMSTGSLGQGMSVGNGLALAAKLDRKDYTVYSMHSDGEAQEGMFWEGAMFAGFRKLDNRICLLDWNNIQIDGYNDQIKDVSPLDEKLQAFGFHVQVIDGHDMAQILSALTEAKQIKGKPKMIVAKTILGKGVSIFENKPKYHGVTPSDEELKIALKELSCHREEPVGRRGDLKLGEI